MNLSILVVTFLIVPVGCVAISETPIASPSAQPAPSLTDVQVIAVRSADLPTWESITPQQSETSLEHGGPWLEVRVQDFGYGRNEKARLAGRDGVQQGRPEPVPSVGIVTGFKRVFRFEGWQAGTFTYESTSHESATLRNDSLRIKRARPAGVVPSTTLRVTLFPWIPDAASDSFSALESRVKTEFENQNPGFNLEFVELITKPDGELQDLYNPDDLTEILTNQADVVEVDMLLLPVMRQRQLIKAWPAEATRGQFHPASVQASKVGTEWFGIPHWLCGHFVISRLQGVAAATDGASLLAALDQGDTDRIDLVGDWLGSWTTSSLYLDAVADSGGAAGVPQTVGAVPDNAQALARLREICLRCARNKYNPCLNGTFDDNDSGPLFFAAGGADAFLGYSEKLHTVLSLDRTPEVFFIGPAALGDGNTPLIFTDSFVLSEKASPEVAAAAARFVQYMNTPATLEWMMLSHDAPAGAPPRYVLPANIDAMALPAIAGDAYYPRFYELIEPAKSFPAAGMLENRKQLRDKVIKAFK